MTKTSDGQAFEAAGTAAEAGVTTRTMPVEFRGADRQANTMTYVQRAVGVTGTTRHFALTVRMKPSFWRKFLKAGPLPPDAMIHLTLEQGIRDDEVCTYATDFSLAS